VAKEKAKVTSGEVAVAMVEVVVVGAQDLLAVEGLESVTEAVVGLEKVGTEAVMAAGKDLVHPGRVEPKAVGTAEDSEWAASEAASGAVELASEVENLGVAKAAVAAGAARGEGVQHRPLQTSRGKRRGTPGLRSLSLRRCNIPRADGGYAQRPSRSRSRPRRHGSDLGYRCRRHGHQRERSYCRTMVG